jgi:hypothetical protein
LSIVIVSYNVKDLLAECLESIFIEEGIPMEVFVVDNNSTDGSCEMVKTKFPAVKLIANNYNAGFPTANNQAIKIATGENIFLLNPDTVLAKSTLSQFRKLFLQHPEIEIAAPRLLNTDGSVQFSIQRFISLKELFLELFFLHNKLKKKESYFNQPITDNIAVEAASGAALFIRKSVFDEIGLLDEKLFWTEDMEFCYRALKNGIATWYIPNIKFVHHIGQSGKKNLKVMISKQVLTKVRYFQKTQGLFGFLSSWVIRLLHILTRIVLFTGLSPFGRQYREKLKAYLFTFMQLIKNDY